MSDDQYITTPIQGRSTVESARTPQQLSRKGPVEERTVAMREHLAGLRTQRAIDCPPGSVCGFCVYDRHVFVHPHSIPGSHWSLEDGCPCCDTHVGPGMWPDDPPMGRHNRTAASSLTSDGG